MASSRKCPPAERLSKLLAGQLEEDTARETLAHFDSFLESSDSSVCLGRLGQYEVLEVIGKGGMGIVLKAHDHTLDRTSAIKVLSPQIASSPIARQRFLREARAAAAISHENVVTIYAVDEFQGFPFLVMEYVDGGSLHDRLRLHGRLEPREACGIGIQVANGLAAAHDRSVVHRDVKPANILLHADGDRVKITDFGLAHVADDLQLTQSGVISGTPPYMSPEQTTGQAVDARSDLFSLGSVLYAMCTGQSPFQAKTVIATIRRVCDEEPVPISVLHAGVPDQLTAIIEGLLAKQPDERYQAATEVADLLQEHLASLTPAPGKTIQKIQQDLAQTSFIATSQPVVDSDTPSIAVLPFENISADPENEYFSDGLAEDLINALSRVERLAVVARTSAFQYKGQRLDVRDAGKRLNVGTVLEGSVRKSGDRIRISVQLIDVASGYQIWSDRYDRDLDDVFAVQDDIAQTIVAELKGKLAGQDQSMLVKPHTHDVDAYSRYLRGRFYCNKRDPEALRRAIDYYDQALALDPEYAVAYAGKADCDVLLADYAISDPQVALKSAKEAAVKALEIDDTLAEAHNSMGFVLACHDHDWTLAEHHYRRAIELDPRSAATRLAYSLSLLVPQRRFEEAMEETSRASRLDPVTPMMIAGRGVVLTYDRHYDKAIAVFQEALELDPQSPVVNLWSTVAWLERGDYERAMAAVQSARPFQLMATEMEAVIQARAGRRDEAVSILQRLFAEVDQGRREAALSVARVYTALGEVDQAIDWLHRALQARVVALVLLAVDPCYDNLREDDRFANLLRQMNLG